MVIDIHGHVGPKQEDVRLLNVAEGNIDGTVEKYIASMDKAGIDLGVTFGFLDLDYEYQAKIQKKYPDRIVSLAWINPRQADSPKIFKNCIEVLELKGLKLHGWWHQFSYSDYNLLDPIIETCDKYKLPVILHVTGDNPNTAPLQAEEIAKRWPDVIFFMAHGGLFWAGKEALLVAKRTKNLYIDTSAMASWWITEFVEEIGAERVAMGSDWPWNHLEAVVATTRISVPDKENQNFVIGETAKKIFNL
jgi:uncharacterized protein